jgi:RNA polymerase primary sigma factor
LLSNNNIGTPNDKLMHESLCDDINRILVTLKSREADVVKYSFGLNSEPPMTLEEIANRMDLTRERIRQIREKALRVLRKKSNSKLLKHYL